jgi:hypothetical protein
LAVDLLAVLHINKLLVCNRAFFRFDPRQINGDAQQAASGAFNLHQVITQSGHSLQNDFLKRQIHSPKKQTTKKNGR